MDTKELNARLERLEGMSDPEQYEAFMKLNYELEEDNLECVVDEDDQYAVRRIKA